MQQNQQPEMVKYLGRIVPKEGFRVFIYNINKEQKLVESWEEYLKEISSGLWHPSLQDLLISMEGSAKVITKNDLKQKDKK